MCRAGIGYDVHRLTAGRKLILGGVEIPSDRGLLGHSDADALLHALMDAMLSAAGLRDIGFYFPDSVPAYAGASSVRLLTRVKELVHGQGYRVVNVSAVIICEKPKLSPFLPAMAECIAETLDLAASEVGISATTNEGLGFLGRAEGIAAQCVCTLIKA